MKWSTALALTLLFIGLPCTAAHAAKRHASAAKKPSGTHAAATVPGKAGTRRSSAHGASARGRQRGRKLARSAAGPALQPHPDVERYQQIQQALADRGYYKGEVNGQWNADSVNALKRFQADQKLESDGKLNSLSLIDLGLGPKHEGGALAAATTPVTSNAAVAATGPSN